MHDHTAIIERYIVCWNETDANRRRTLVEEIWTESATYVDPLMQGAGHDGIYAMIDAVQKQFPGFQFSLTGPVHSLAVHARFSWRLAPEGAAALVEGTDFAIIAADGRLESVTGFLDRVPAAA
ncbi:MAG: nuclear transport factor 2 family protein [bacterium]